MRKLSLEIAEYLEVLQVDKVSRWNILFSMYRLRTYIANDIIIKGQLLSFQIVLNRDILSLIFHRAIILVSREAEK